MKKPLIRLLLTILIIDSANGGEGLANQMAPFDTLKREFSEAADKVQRIECLKKAIDGGETGLPHHQIKEGIEKIRKASDSEEESAMNKLFYTAFGRKFGLTGDQMADLVRRLFDDNNADAIAEAEELIAESEKNARAFKEIGEMLMALYKKEFDELSVLKETEENKEKIFLDETVSAQNYAEFSATMKSLEGMNVAKFFTIFDFVKKSLAKKCKTTEEELEKLKLKMQRLSFVERAEGRKEIKTMIEGVKDTKKPVQEENKRHENAQRHEKKRAEERQTSSGFKAVPWMAMIVVILYFVQ